MRLISFEKQVHTSMYIQKYRYICTVLQDAGQYSWRGMDQAISCETVLTTRYRLPARGHANPLAGNPFNDYIKWREHGFGAPMARPGKTVLRMGVAREVERSFRAVPFIRFQEDSRGRYPKVEIEGNTVERRVCKSLDQGESLRFSESGPAWDFEEQTCISGYGRWIRSWV